MFRLGRISPPARIWTTTPSRSKSCSVRVWPAAAATAWTYALESPSLRFPDARIESLTVCLGGSLARVTAVRRVGWSAASLTKAVSALGGGAIW